MAGGVWTRRSWRRIGDHVTLLDEPAPVEIVPGTVLYPCPLRQKQSRLDPTEWIPPREVGDRTLRIGLAHGSLDTLPATGNFPIAVDRTERSGLDYLALGDWHGTLEIAPRSWYSGTHEPDRFRENDPGNVLVVRLAAPGADPDVEKVRVGRCRWLSANQSVHDEMDVAGVESAPEALGEPFEDTLVWLHLSGTIGLETRERLEAMLNGWRARLLHIRVDDDGLVAEPSQDDLD